MINIFGIRDSDDDEFLSIWYLLHKVSFINCQLECCKEFDQEYHKYMVKLSLELIILMLSIVPKVPDCIINCFLLFVKQFASTLIVKVVIILLHNRTLSRPRGLPRGALFHEIFLLPLSFYIFFCVGLTFYYRCHRAKS